MVKVPHEKAEAAVSYLTGCGMVTLSFVAEIATYAQALGLILGFLLVVVRLAYDIRKLIKDW